MKTSLTKNEVEQIIKKKGIAHRKRQAKNYIKHGWIPVKFEGLALPYQTRLNRFKRAKVKFDCNSLTAWSYDWWIFVRPIGNKLVFNDFRYSSTTSKHQSQVTHLLDQLGIKIDVFVRSKCSLGDPSWSSEAIAGYEHEINTLMAEINKPRSHKAKNDLRAKTIKALKVKIQEVKRLQRKEQEAI